MVKTEKLSELLGMNRKDTSLVPKEGDTPLCEAGMEVSVWN